MREERGMIAGELDVRETLTLWGTVAGNVRVGLGGKFYLRGTVYGSVQVDPGGRANLLGSVKGNVSLDEETKVIVSGLIAGNAVNKGGRLYIERAANILGKVRTDAGKTVVEKKTTPAKSK